jgi:hypothetical protein
MAVYLKAGVKLRPGDVDIHDPTRWKDHSILQLWFREPQIDDEVHHVALVATRRHSDSHATLEHSFKRPYSSSATLPSLPEDLGKRLAFSEAEPNGCVDGILDVANSCHRA